MDVGAWRLVLTFCVLDRAVSSRKTLYLIKNRSIAKLLYLIIKHRIITLGLDHPCPHYINHKVLFRLPLLGGSILGLLDRLESWFKRCSLILLVRINGLQPLTEHVLAVYIWKANIVANALRIFRPTEYIQTTLLLPQGQNWGILSVATFDHFNVFFLILSMTHLRLISTHSAISRLWIALFVFILCPCLHQRLNLHNIRFQHF